MKFCYFCGRTTAGKPTFCTECGRSYDQKVCPRLHENPRWAEACARCGSRNLSTPQPRIPFLWRLTTAIVMVASALYLTVMLVGLASEFVGCSVVSSTTCSRFMFSGCLLGILWGLWTVLPHVLRRVAWRTLQRRREQNHR